MHVSARAKGFEPLLVAVIALAIAFLVQGRSEVLTNDEGIILEPAKRILRGERPYVDFFAYMSPGSYWIHAASLKLFGENLVAGRVPVLLGFAIQCAFLFWVVNRYAESRRAAITAAALYFVFQMASPDLLTPQHRWDSGTLAVIAIWLVLNKRMFWLAGICAAGAVLCTPSLVLIAALIAVWLWWNEGARRASAFAGGGVLLAIPVTAYLVSTGELGPLIEQLRWLSRNYAEVNRVPYGMLIGGWGAVFEGSNGVDLPVRGLIALGLALPALLPVLGVGLWAWRWRYADSAIRLLLGAGVALTAASFPRPDVMHLAFTMAIPFGLVAIWMARFLKPTQSAGIAAAVSVSALLFVFPIAGRAMAGPSRALAQVRANVPAGSTLYVHPYMPVLYFLTRAHNPTSYDYLAPGMMTAEDEARVLADLERCPPDRILYLKLERKEFLRVFPNATRLSEKFPRIESWIEARYRPGKESAGGYRLWHKIKD